MQDTANKASHNQKLKYLMQIGMTEQTTEPTAHKTDNANDTLNYMETFHFILHKNFFTLCLCIQCL